MVSNINNNQSNETFTEYKVSDTKTDPNLTALTGEVLEWVEDTANDVYAIWDEEGTLIHISKSVEKMLGYTMEELKSLTWQVLLDDEDIMLFKQKFDKFTLKKQFFNLNIRHQNERYIWCECIIKKKINQRDGKVYFLTTFRDNTDKKEIEEMMIRSEKMSIAGQLAAGVAHEIRNPLTSIKGFLQLLQAGINHKDEYYKIMIEEIEKMEVITSEMLFISKPLTDYQQEENIIEMIDDVIILLRTQANIKDIELIRKNATDAFIYCDKSQVKQVLINLVKNAIEAMDHPGTITLEHRTTESSVEVDVIDEGPGISQEMIHKLDEPFFTTKPNGTGLGLMITKQILDRHDATMDILQNEHGGSTFRLRFLLNK